MSPPIYDFSKKFQTLPIININKSIILFQIAEVSADRGNGGDIMKRFGVTGLPEIWFFSKTNKKGVEYKGDLSSDGLFNFLSDHCATEKDGDL